MTADLTGWDRAWAAASTGPGGFWHSASVAEHFRTASASPVLAQLISSVLADLPEVSRVIEVGAGDGVLLQNLRLIAPEPTLTGIDLRPPAVSMPGVEWLIGRWDSSSRHWLSVDDGVASTLASLDRPTMIICCEWLDELPCPVAIRSDDGWREVLVATDGREQTGGPVVGPAAEWLDTWWPDGVRAEIGLSRDAAWSELITALGRSGGAALMIDYGHLRSDRPVAGSLTAYAGGREHTPRPDPTMNLTAEVAVDAVEAAGVRAGARTVVRARQRDLIDRLGTRPPAGDRLSRLQTASERAALAGPLGHHWWLLQTVPAS